MKDRAVMTRTNLSIKLLPEEEEDKKLAALLSYQTADCKYLSYTRKYIKVLKLKFK